MHIAELKNLRFSESDFHVLRIKGGFRSVAALARKAGLSGSYVRQVSGGLIPSERTRQRIAAALGVAVERIWRQARGARSEEREEGAAA